MLIALATLGGAGSAHAALPTTTKLSLKCQTTIRKVTRTFVRKKLSLLDKCANGVLKCIQTIPDSDPKQQACVIKAGQKCAKPEGGAFAKIAAEEAKLVLVIRKTCAVNGLTIDDLRGANGLGFDNLAGDCPSLATVEDIAECIGAQHECEAEQLFAVQEPRALQLIQAGVSAAGLTAPPLTCLDDLGGGENLDNPGVGKQLVKCESAIQKAARAFIEEKLRRLGMCVDRAFLCVQTKEGADRVICLESQPARFCKSEFKKIEAAAALVGPSMDAKCGPVPAFFDTAMSIPDGAHLAAPTEACADVGTDPATYDGYKACLVAQHEARVDELLRFQMPRADELLAISGCDLDTLTCGLPTPTITPTPTVTPTPP